MRMNAQIQSVIELLDIFFDAQIPFDIIMAKFFKNNKWIGGHDKRKIAELTYSILRNFEKLKFMLSDINTGRSFVLAYLKMERSLSIREIQELFNGEIYAPRRLSSEEEQFLTSLVLPKELPDYVVGNYPQWLTPYLEHTFGVGNVAREMSALNEKAYVDLRVNTLKSTRSEVYKLLSKDFELQNSELSENCIRVLNGRISKNHPVLIHGLAEIQDEGSQLIAEICGAKPGDTVVDYCAGAGGKTLALAALMQNKGRIFALDKYASRLEHAKLRCRRAGVSNVFIQEITSKWAKRHAKCADIVLVDAPCSGTGTWRRNPDMRAKFQPSDLSELQATQLDILKQASKLVKPGGRLVYATCSILRDEDEDQIEKFLLEFPQFHLQTIKVISYVGEYLRLTPANNKTDGFFAAVLIN